MTETVGLFAPAHTPMFPGATGQTCWLVNHDLNGDTAGSISQTIPTVVGHHYQVTFYMGNDPYFSMTGSLMSVMWGGVDVGDLMSPTGGSTAVMVDPISPAWAPESLTVTATSTSSALEFAAGDTTYTDYVALNNVQVVDLDE
jgi:hypothetical protein